MSLITNTDYLQIENKKISQIREEDLKDEFGKFGPIGNYILIFHELFSPVVIFFREMWIT